MSEAAWYRRDGGSWLIEVHVQPGAKTSAVAGLHGGALKLRIAAPPLEGRANEALCAFIARALGVPKAAVSIARGESSRHKRVRVAAPAADPRSLLENVQTTERGPGSDRSDGNRS